MIGHVRAGAADQQIVAPTPSKHVVPGQPAQDVARRRPHDEVAASRSDGRARHRVEPGGADPGPGWPRPSPQLRAVEARGYGALVVVAAVPDRVDGAPVPIQPPDALPAGIDDVD